MRQVLGEVLRYIVEHTGASYGAVLSLDRLSRTLAVDATTDGDAGTWPRSVGMDELPWLDHPRDHNLEHPIANNAHDLPADIVAWHRGQGYARCTITALRRGETLSGALALAYEGEPVDPPNLGANAAVRSLMSCAALALEVGRHEEEVAECTTALAREIHDTLAQSLALIVMQLADAQDKLGPAWTVAREPLETARQLAVHSLAQARLSVSVLRPPRAAPGGLCGVVHEMAALVRRYYRGHLDVRVTGAPHEVEAAVEAELAGIVREALTNAATHAQAGRIEVAVEFPDERGVTILVADDGQGFDPDRAREERYGLVGMRERAGRIGAALTVITEPGAGTQVIAVWP